MDESASKVAAVTWGFWIIKILATTLGETGGDAVSMSLNLGYLLSTAIFAAIFAVLVSAQIAATHYNRFLYWAVIVATTTVGTTLADFADRSLGIGYPGGTLILAALVGVVLAAWYLREGSVSVARIRSRAVEALYWLTILFSNTLGTALGDWTADSGPGYEGGALIFGAMLAGLAVLFSTTRISRTLLFWAAFVLTRPLGATLGDMLTKPGSAGGLALDRVSSSAVIAVAMVLCILATGRQGGDHPDAHARA